MSEYKPMSGRPDRMRLNCEDPARQSIGGRNGIKAKLDANQIDAIWNEVQAHTRETLRWTAPTGSAG